MNQTERAVAKFTNGFNGEIYRSVFALLESHGLRPLGKSNTDTLLFQHHGSGGNVSDVFAFRLGPPPVISFPSSYWNARSGKLSDFLGRFSYMEQQAVTGKVSDSQYSSGQIEIKKGTYERIIQLCTE